MTRLPSEWLRLYLVDSAEGHGVLPCAANGARLVDEQGRVRAMVLTLARPADWSVLASVWQAVQAELGLPAPAIAVSGVDAYQLWFSLAEAVPAREAHAFLEGLRARYLGEVARARVGLLPDADADADLGAAPGAPRAVRHVALWPGQQALPEQWAAFVARDLAPMFDQTPWLDIPPSPEGQADLLSGLQSIKPLDWQAAWARLQPAPAAASASAPTGELGLDPERFLRQVLNDETVALALRIEAAKALLPRSRP